MSDLSNFRIKATLPETIFLPMVRPFSKALIWQGTWIFLVTIAFHLVTMQLGLLLFLPAANTASGNVYEPAHLCREPDARISMIVVGLSLSCIHLGTVNRRNRRLDWIISAVSLFSVPLLTALAVKLSPVGDGKLMEEILVMIAALPTASAFSILTEQYGTNTKLAPKTVFVSTLFSVLTIPFVMSIAF